MGQMILCISLLLTFFANESVIDRVNNYCKEKEGKTYDEIKLALNGGIRQFNVESIPEIIMINKIASSLGKKAPISIRVNPDVDAQTHKKIMTGTSENKFGIPLNSALEVYKIASELNSIEMPSANDPPPSFASASAGIASPPINSPTPFRVSLTATDFNPPKIA